MPSSIFPRTEQGHESTATTVPHETQLHRICRRPSQGVDHLLDITNHLTHRDMKRLRAYGNEYHRRAQPYMQSIKLCEQLRDIKVADLVRKYMHYCPACLYRDSTPLCVSCMFRGLCGSARIWKARRQVDNQIAAEQLKMNDSLAPLWALFDREPNPAYKQLRCYIGMDRLADFAADVIHGCKPPAYSPYEEQLPAYDSIHVPNYSDH